MIPKEIYYNIDILDIIKMFVYWFDWTPSDIGLSEHSSWGLASCPQHS
jgi:hypothetical protein